MDELIAFDLANVIHLRQPQRKSILLMSGISIFEGRLLTQRDYPCEYSFLTLSFRVGCEIVSITLYFSTRPYPYR